MLKNLYSPLSGSIAQERVMAILSNNLANANTVGFKEEHVTFKLLDPEPEHNYKNPLPPANYKVPYDEVLPLKGNEFAYVGVSGVHRNDQQGPALQTKNPLDLMLKGEGYLTVHTHEGMRFTRGGSLTLNEDGALTDKMGNPVLGQKGVIFLGASQVKINHLGEVYQDGKIVDQLQLKKFKNSNDLEKVGLNYFFYGGPEDGMQTADGIRVEQGFLEGSNVNAIRNLTSMILAHRSFEAYQKSIKNMDTMMETSSNSIGQVRV